MSTPLFVCHADCCRSVLASHLYRHLCDGAAVQSAGFEPGDRLSHKAEEMLRLWGIDAGHHRPRKLTRQLCEQADGIFLMGPTYLHRLLREHGDDLAAKAYLFADPFTRPQGFKHGEYRVYDPSFDARSADRLLGEYSWFRERVLQIRLALLRDGRRPVPAAEYRDLIRGVDPYGH